MFYFLCDEMPLSDAFGWVAGRGMPHPAGLKNLSFRGIVMVISRARTPLPSNGHHRSSGDCLEDKRENYQVCSVQHCVQ